MREVGTCTCAWAFKESQILQATATNGKPLLASQCLGRELESARRSAGHAGSGERPEHPEGLGKALHGAITFCSIDTRAHSISPSWVRRFAA